MKKRIAIVVAVAMMATAGVYFGVVHSSSEPEVPTLAEGFGIWESEIIIDDAEPGATGLVPLTIICGQDQDRTFMVTVEVPSEGKTKNGYQPFPENLHNWLTLPDDLIYIEAGGHHSLEIPFRMPYTATVPPGTQMEARLRVTEVGHGGLVHIGIEARWYIIVTASP